MPHHGRTVYRAVPIKRNERGILCSLGLGVKMYKTKLTLHLLSFFQHWGLDASEIIIMLSTLAAFLVVMLHSHRFVPPPPQEGKDGGGGKLERGNQRHSCTRQLARERLKGESPVLAEFI